MAHPPANRIAFVPSRLALAVTFACVVACALAGTARADGAGTASSSARGDVPSPFALDPAELDPIRFTRLPDEEAYGPAREPVPGPRTEFSFSLSPKRPDFSLKGAYGLGALFGEPEIAIAGVPRVPFRRGGEELATSLAGGRASGRASGLTSGLTSALPGGPAAGPSLGTLNDGFRYSAGVRIEHEDADIDGTAYVSSSLLGLSYGRLGRLWYGGIDVNLEQFADERHGKDRPDVLSLDVTTGRRLGITGLGADAPLWLLSLRGDFDLLDAEADETLEPESAWYLNPSLFWRHPGFTFSAEMQLPVPVDTADPDVLLDDEKPDYRLRAVFEKRFK